MNAGLSAVEPRPRAARRVYYGWFVLLVASAAMVGTLPARTQGLGLVTEPLLADLGITHVEYATLNLWATLLGSLGAIGIGRALDRFGGRGVLALVSLALGTVVCLMSRVHSFATLAVCVTLTRGLGQSALSVVSLALVGQWFVRRIDKAMALYGLATSIGFMCAFPLTGALIQSWGWRGAWFALGCALLAGLAPLALLVVRRGPEACGLLPDGESDADSSVRPSASVGALSGHTARAALATPAFWVFAVGAALYGLVASGIGLFNERILAERGFGADVYYQTLVVTALTALVGNGLGGWLAARVRLGLLMAAALFVLALGLAVLPQIATLPQVQLWAATMGLGGGLVMVLFFSVWPRVFGRRELGRIQGAAQAITVFASAVGPLLLEWFRDWTGSYRAIFQILALVIAAVGALAYWVRLPAPAADGARA
ncbi:MAG: MFS transporter [Planctomycetes bacterium]|nr:MFS transporter [Planctomycetota bacterium]